MNVSDDGILTFYGEKGEIVRPKRIEVGRAYSRAAKPPKVLTRISSDPSKIQLDPNRALLRFDWVVAVDTNTMEIGGTEVSMTVPVLVKDIELGKPKWTAQLVPQDAFEFHDATVSPERIGWREIIKGITSHPDVHGNIALIVDSELGSLTAINSREVPIIEGFFLPANIELLYGSVDGGTVEYVANAALADCDKTASRLLKRLAQNGISGEYLSDAGRHHGRYKYWKYGPVNRTA
jgi:hypothetical protein